MRWFLIAAAIAILFGVVRKHGADTPKRPPRKTATVVTTVDPPTTRETTA